MSRLNTVWGCMKHVKVKGNQRGLGILEILICVAIVGFMSIAIARMMTNANNANRNITMTLEATSVTQLLTMLLSDRNFCDTNFTKNNVIEIDLDNLANLTIPINKMAYPATASEPNPEVIFDRAAPKSPSNSVLVSNMFLSNIKSLNTGLQIGKLNIVFDKGATAAGPAMITRGLYLRLETVTVTGNVVRVLHCNTVGTTPIDSTPTGEQPKGDQQEIDDKLFENLLAGVKNTIFVNDKVNLVMDMIATWQKLGLVSMGRYMTISKLNTLIKDGGVIDLKSDKGNLCDYFSGKIIDVGNAPLVQPTISQVGGTACSVQLSK